MKSHYLVAIELILAVAGVACEGEPPKTPPLGTGDQPLPIASETPETVETVAPPPSQASACTPCCPGCGANAVATTSMDASAGGDAAVAVASDAGAPVVAARGEIIGKITTSPAYLSGVSAVWLEDAPIEPTRGMSAHIDNKQMMFTPMVQMIAKGGTVAFVNTDPFPHNVFSPDGKFNLGTIPQNSAASPRHFDKVGAFTVLCNLHPNMIGYLIVAPSSYFAKTDGVGRYRIKDVPAGTYKITAWAPRLATVTETVTLAGPTATTDFELHR